MKGSGPPWAEKFTLAISTALPRASLNWSHATTGQRPRSEAKRSSCAGKTLATNVTSCFGTGTSLPLLLQAEGTLFMQLRADGERLFIEPAAKLIHAHELSWSVFLSGSFLSSRMATACAVKLSGEEGMRKLAGALLGPVRWPLVLLRRTRSLPDRATWERRFWLYLPFVLLYYSTVAVGTLCGLAFGIGGSDRQFFNAEANSVRKVPAPPGRAKA